MDNRLTSSRVPQEKVSHAFMTLGWVKKGSLFCVWSELICFLQNLLHTWCNSSSNLDTATRWCHGERKKGCRRDVECVQASARGRKRERNRWTDECRVSKAEVWGREGEGGGEWVKVCEQSHTAEGGCVLSNKPEECRRKRLGNQR